MKKWIVVLSIFVLGAGLAQAANVWDGGGTDDNWNTAGNWDDNLVPTFPVGLNFGGTTRLTPNNDLSSLTVNGLTFDSGAGAFVLGGNAITLGGDIVNNSATAETIDLDMVLGSTRTVNVAAGNVTLNGALSGTGGLTMTGAKTLNIYGNNTFSGLVTLSSGTVKTYSGTAFGTGDVTWNGAKWNAGSGVTIANNMNFANNMIGNALSQTTDFTGQFTGAGNIYVNGFAAGVTKLSGDNSGWSGNWEFQGVNKLQLNHVNALGTGTKITFDNASGDGKSRGVLESLVDLSGANALDQDINLGVNVYVDNTATIRTVANMELTGVISGNSSTRLIKEGTGKLYLSGANTYAGGTTLSSGTVVTGNDAAFGTGDVVFNGAQWNSAVSAVIANDVDFANNMTGNSLSHTTEFTGQFTGAGNVSVNGFESGVTKLSGDNSGWSGNWNFNGRNKLQLNNVDALGTGTTITFSTPTTAGYVRGTLESLVDLTGANALTQNVHLGDATGLSGNVARFTATSAMELAGVVSGAADAILFKNGDGTLTLSSANTYSGGTELQAGVLVGNADGAFGTGGMSVSDGAKLTLQGGSSNNNLDDLVLLILGSSAELSMDFTGVADTVGGISLDGGLTFLSGGTYDAAALDVLGSGTYSGAGSLTVIPEPATLGLITICFGGMWAMRRLMM